MFNTSILELDPPIGTPGQIVRVRWRLGSDDLSFEPTIDDEIRMTTSSGELLSRTSLDFKQNDTLTSLMMKQLQQQQQQHSSQHQHQNNNHNNNNTFFEPNTPITSTQNIGRKSTTTLFSPLNSSSSPILAGGVSAVLAGRRGTTSRKSTTEQMFSSVSFHDIDNNNNGDDNHGNIGGSHSGSLLHPEHSMNSIAANVSGSMHHDRRNASMSCFSSGGASATTTTNNNSLFSGERFLRCPPFSGGFIVSLYRCSKDFQRVLSVPYRVEKTEMSFEAKAVISVEGGSGLLVGTSSSSFSAGKNNNNNNNNNNEKDGAMMMSTPQLLGSSFCQSPSASTNNPHSPSVLTTSMSISTTTATRQQNQKNNNNPKKCFFRPFQTVSVTFSWKDIVMNDENDKNSELHDNNNNNNTTATVLGVPLHEAKQCAVLVLCADQSPDNSGFSTESTFLDHNNFSHCCRKVRLVEDADSFFVSSSSSSGKNNNNKSENKEHHHRKSDDVAFGASTSSFSSSLGNDDDDDDENNAKEEEDEFIKTIRQQLQNQKNSSDTFLTSEQNNNTNNNSSNNKIEKHFVGPEIPGDYVCRLMVRAATNIFHTAAFSLPFTVVSDSKNKESSSSSENEQQQQQQNESASNSTNLAESRNIFEFSQNTDNQFLLTKLQSGSYNNNDNSNNFLANSFASNAMMTAPSSGTFLEQSQSNNNNPSNIIPRQVLISQIAMQKLVPNYDIRKRFGAPSRRGGGEANFSSSQNQQQQQNSNSNSLTPTTATITPTHQRSGSNALEQQQMSTTNSNIFSKNNNNMVLQQEEPSLYPQTSLLMIASKYRVYAGQYIRVFFDVRAAAFGNTLPFPSITDVTRRHLPSSLDHIRFIPYGRSECDKYDGSISLTVNGDVHSGMIAVKTPNVSGSFDLAYRRFTDNETLVLAKTHIVTEWPDGEIILFDDINITSAAQTNTQQLNEKSSFSFFSNPNNNGNDNNNPQTTTSKSSSTSAALSRQASNKNLSRGISHSASFFLGYKNIQNIPSSSSNTKESPSSSSTSNKRKAIDFAREKDRELFDGQDFDDENNSSNNQQQQKAVIQLIKEQHETVVLLRIKPGFMASYLDRVIVFDETATIVAFSLVEWESIDSNNNNNEQQQQTSSSYSSPATSSFRFSSSTNNSAWRNGKAIVRIPITGRYNVRLNSARVGHVLPCKCKELLTVPASATYPLPYASMLVLKKVSVRAADIGISFAKLTDVPDLRPKELQERDAVVICPFHYVSSGDTQFATPSQFDDPNANRFLRFHILYGAENKFVVFDIKTLKPARYAIRYMVATANPFVRVCTSECYFDLLSTAGKSNSSSSASERKHHHHNKKKKSSSNIIGEHHEKDDDENEHENDDDGDEDSEDDDDIIIQQGGELEIPRDCDMHTSQQFIERLSASQLSHVRHLRRNVADIASYARQKLQGEESATVTSSSSPLLLGNKNNNKNNNDQEEDKKRLQLENNNSSKQQFQKNSRIPKPELASQPWVVDGNLLAPIVIQSGEIFKANVNIAFGAPRSTDLILLCSEDLSKVFTQVSMGNVMDYGKSLSDGIAFLYAPSMPCKCVAAYYSQVQKGVLFRSNVIKVRKAQQQQQQQQQQIQGEESSATAASAIMTTTTTKKQQIQESTTTIDSNTTLEERTEDLRKIFDMLMRRRSTTNNNNNNDNDTILLSGNASFNNNDSIISSPAEASPFSPFAASMNASSVFSASRVFSPTTTAGPGNHSQYFSHHHQKIRTPRMRVLLVGVSYLKQRYDLDGPPNDIAAIYSMLEQHFTHTLDSSFDPEKDVRVLHEHSVEPLFHPTASHIREGLCWLVEEAIPGDHLIFFFSGSGALIPQMWNYEYTSTTRNSSSSCQSQNENRNFNYNGNNNNNFNYNGNNNSNNNSNNNNDNNNKTQQLPMQVDQVLLPCDFDFGKRSISYREIIQELFVKAGNISKSNISVTAIIDAGFSTTAIDVMDQRRGINLQDAVEELGVTMVEQQRKELFNFRTRSRCVPPPQPYPLVTIASDQESIEAPPLASSFSNSNNNNSYCETKTKTSSSSSQIISQSFQLNGLSPDFVSCAGVSATSYTTAEIRPYLLQQKLQRQQKVEEETESSSGSNNIPINSFFFEASRGGSDAYCWDTFSQWAGTSMGLFTSSFVSVLHSIARERRGLSLSGVSWYDILERTQRAVRRAKGGEYQLPLLWTSSSGFYDSEISPFLNCAFPLAVERDDS